MKLNRNFPVLFTACMALASPATADTVTKGLEQTARDVGNGVVGLLNAFGSGKLKPDNIELLSDSKVALSFNGQRFNNPCGIEVFWGDGSSEKFRVEKDAYKTGFTLEHQYDTPQDYQIEINGKVIFRGLKTVVNCPGNFEGTIALANQAPASSIQPSRDQTTQTLSPQSEEALANAEKIKALEAEVAKKQAERIAELEAQLEAQANDEKIKKLENELAEKQAKRIAELEAQLVAQENNPTPTSRSELEEDKSIDSALSTVIGHDKNHDPNQVSSQGQDPDPKTVKNTELSISENTSSSAKVKPPTKTIRMPELKGEKVHELQHKQWAHILYCDGRMVGKDRYTSVWKHNNQVVKADKFKKSGSCRDLVRPDLIMTNIAGTPVSFPSKDVNDHCNKQLQNPWFDPLREEVPSLTLATFYKPKFELLSSKSFASPDLTQHLSVFNDYFEACYVRFINEQISGASVSSSESRRLQNFVNFTKSLHKSGIASLARGEVAFGEAAEIISSGYQDAANQFNNNGAMISAAQQAAYQNRLNASKARNAELQRSTQDALTQGLGGVSKALRSTNNNGTSNFRKNRKRECALQGKLYMNGSCR